MTALGRINLGVSLLFVLVTLAGLALLLRQSGHDVRRELLAAEAVVEYLGEVARSNPGSLRPELTENLRQNLSVDWSERESVRAKLRLMVKRILRKYKYPPDLEVAAVELVLEQARALGEAWVA